MNFAKALEILTDGRSVSRPTGHVVWVRQVDPRVEPDTDGPKDVFIVTSGERPVSGTGEYETEADAKAELKALRSSLAAEWKKYDVAQKRWEEVKGTAETALPGVHPSRHKNYYEDAVVVPRAASRARRLNKAYMVCRLRSGELTPWLPTNEDLFAQDWKEA